jgi:hypothetical protein
LGWFLRIIVLPWTFLRVAGPMAAGNIRSPTFWRFARPYFPILSALASREGTTILEDEDPDIWAEGNFRTYLVAMIFISIRS